MGRSRLGRPWRRLRRWWRHAPPADGLTLLGIGLALLVVATALWLTIV